MKSPHLLVVAIGLAGLTWIFAPEDAEACGGFMCDTGPTAMQVDQTGENIIFAQTVDGVEAHIQIQYTGDAPKFAWVVPLQAVPEFAVGSQALFDQVMRETVPTRALIQQVEPCGFGGSSGTGGSSFSAAASGSAGSSSSSSGGPTVVLRETVGAFDVTVLSGGTGQEVWNWLATNGYQQPGTALPILEEYVSSGHVFAAIRLLGGTQLEELHPIVLKFSGTRPCVPLKLTRIAAVNDMGVRVFFLGDRRVVPINYVHVEPNPLMLDWLQLGANYFDYIRNAVDDPAAEGRGFVTEFAGPNFSSADSRIYSNAWDAFAVDASTYTTVVDVLYNQGLMNCYPVVEDWRCDPAHPLLRPILDRYLPVPSGVDASTFWGCVSCYETLVDQNAWDSHAFADELVERIIDPGFEARALFNSATYITRLFTAISPSEMLDDPEFIPWTGLPDVPRTEIATTIFNCPQNTNRMEVPNGGVVYYDGSNWPQWDSSMPAAKRVERFTVNGERQLLADRSSSITAAQDAHNTRMTSGAASSSSSGLLPGLPRPGDEDGVGCACRVTDRPADSVAMLGLLLGLVLLGRRLRW